MSELGKIQLGEKVFSITDPHRIQPVAADVITEFRISDNIVCLSLGATVIDGDGNARIETSARLRIGLSTAANMRNMLDDLLKKIMPPKESAN